MVFYILVFLVLYYIFSICILKVFLVCKIYLKLFCKDDMVVYDIYLLWKYKMSVMVSILVYLKRNIEIFNIICFYWNFILGKGLSVF